MSNTTNQTAKFTPGPWRAVITTGFLRVKAANGWIIAQMPYNDKDNSGIQKDEAIANTNLMAHALEMYQFIENVERGQYGELKGQFISRIRKEAKNILTRAIGGTK